MAREVNNMFWVIIGIIYFSAVFMVLIENRPRKDKVDLKAEWEYHYKDMHNNLKSQIISSVWEKIPEGILSKEQAENLAPILADGADAFISKLNFKVDNKYRLIILLDENCFDYFKRIDLFPYDIKMEDKG